LCCTCACACHLASDIHVPFCGTVQSDGRGIIGPGSEKTSDVWLEAAAVAAANARCKHISDMYAGAYVIVDP
jgi:hypothetical protein